MFKISMHITEDQVKPKLEKAHRGLYTTIGITMRKSTPEIHTIIKPLVPYEYGYLEDGFEDDVTLFEDGAWLDIEYSGRRNPEARRKNYDYALIQHENTSFNHPIKGQAFYLEKGLKLAFPTVMKNIDKDLDKLMRIG